jgi:hypothetical protein
MLTIFVGRWWRAPAKARAVTRLRGMLDDIENGLPGDPGTPRQTLRQHPKQMPPF